MTSKRISFVNKYYPYAYEVWLKTGFPISSILAQCAIETGNGATIVGNMMFGVKSTKTDEPRQLLVTKEESKNGNLIFPEIKSKVLIDGIYHYIVKDWFRKYNSPEESFSDHANFLLKNKRYANALKFKDKPTYFSREIARAGYATAVGYDKTFISVTLEIYLYLVKVGQQQ